MPLFNKYYGFIHFLIFILASETFCNLSLRCLNCNFIVLFFAVVYIVINSCEVKPKLLH